MGKTFDSTTMELPVVLRDLIASHRLHPRMALHEVVEEALLFWMERGAWAGMAGPWLPSPHAL